MAEKAEIIATFRKFDANGDGTITRSELQALMARLGTFNEGELEALMSQMDKNGDGVISYEEFIEYLYSGGDSSCEGGISRLPRPVLVHDSPTTGPKALEADGAPFQLGAGFTFAGWVCVQEWTGEYNRIYDFGTPRTKSARLHRNGGSTLRLGFNVSDTCDFDEYFADSDMGQWVHVAVTVSAGGDCLAYKNGGVLGEGSMRPPRIGWDPSPRYFIGQSNWPNEPDSLMLFRALRWFGAALTAGEIAELSSDREATTHYIKDAILDAHRMPKLGYVNWSATVPVPPEYESRGCHVSETHRRAMTLSQLADLGKFSSRVLDAVEITDPHPQFSVGRITSSNINLYLMNDLFVLPLTNAFRCSFMELAATCVQDPVWFISHWWGTPFCETISMLSYHAIKHDLELDSTYWMCTFANNQHNLEELEVTDLRETPFVQAIMNPVCVGTIMLMDKAATPFKRTWCTLENFISTTDGKQKDPPLRLDIGAVIKAGSQRGGAGSFRHNDQDIPALLMDDGDGELEDHVASSALGFQFPAAVAAAAVRTDVAAAQASNLSDKHNILRLIIGERVAGGGASEPPATHPRYDTVNGAIARIFAKRALFGAALKCDAEEADRLLRSGMVTVEDEDQTDRTPLIIACQNLADLPDESLRVPLIRVLLEHRADPNHRTTSLGICGLHPAAYWNLPETIEVLADAGGDVNLGRECDGMLPIQEAKANGSQKAIAKLRELGSRG